MADTGNTRGTSVDTTSAARRGDWLTGWLIMVAGAPLSILAMLGAWLADARAARAADAAGRRADRSGV